MINHPAMYWYPLTGRFVEARSIALADASTIEALVATKINQLRGIVMKHGELPLYVYILCVYVYIHIYICIIHIYIYTYIYIYMYIYIVQYVVSLFGCFFATCKTAGQFPSPWRPWNLSSALRFPTE